MKKPIGLIILTAVVALTFLVNPSKAAAAEVVVEKVVDEGEEPAPVASTTFKRELAAGSMSMSLLYEESMSYDYYYDAKSSKKSAKTPKGNDRTSRRDLTCYLPFAASCFFGSESCWRVRWQNSRGEWVTSGTIGSIRGTCVRDGRCLPAKVLQPYVRSRTFEELARNCCGDAELVSFDCRLLTQRPRFVACL